LSGVIGVRMIRRSRIASFTALMNAASSWGCPARC
jgi:hypothetical protein